MSLYYQDKCTVPAEVRFKWRQVLEVSSNIHELLLIILSMDAKGYYRMREGITLKSQRQFQKAMILIDSISGHSFNEFKYRDLDKLKCLLPLTYCSQVFSELVPLTKESSMSLSHLANIKKMPLSTTTLRDVYRLGKLFEQWPELANQLSEASRDFYQKKGKFDGTTLTRQVIENRALPLYLLNMELKTLNDVMAWHFDLACITHKHYTALLKFIIGSFDHHLGFHGRHSDFWYLYQAENFTIPLGMGFRWEQVPGNNNTQMMVPANATDGSPSADFWPPMPAPPPFAGAVNSNYLPTPAPTQVLPLYDSMGNLVHYAWVAQPPVPVEAGPAQPIASLHWRPFSSSVAQPVFSRAPQPLTHSTTIAPASTAAATNMTFDGSVDRTPQDLLSEELVSMIDNPPDMDN